MTQTAANVKVGVTGSIYKAPTATSLPTTVDEALDGSFNDVGYISEDGVTTATNADTNDIRAWQNGDTVRKVQTSHDFTVAFTMLETNSEALELYYGNFTAGPGGDPGVVQVQASQGFRGCFVMNVVDDDQLIRIVLPDAQVSERQDVVYVNGDAISYGVTLTCYADTSGVKAYIYFETDAAS